MKQKIRKALEKIYIFPCGHWYVPNRKELNMSVKEFIEFERYRLNEFSNDKIKMEKYKYHYDIGQKDLFRNKNCEVCYGN